MTLSLPLRRFAPPRCLFCHPLPISSRIPRHQQCRPASSGQPSSSSDSSPQPNPVLEEYKRNNPDLPTLQQLSQQQQQRPTPGDLSASSIFEDDLRTQQQAQRDSTAASPDSFPPDSSPPNERGNKTRDPANSARVLDPDPNARERWERKKIIQMVRRGGRLSKTAVLKRTEREHLVRSHNMKTSVKKLGMLARQIAGKTVEEAVEQLRFSRKKVAVEVLKQLEFARDEAVVMRGMGLGGEGDDGGSTAERKANTPTPPADINARSKEKKEKSKPISIQLKSGTRHLVTDAHKIYIDQAWVGRGPYGKLPDYRARGRLFIMRTPFTSISLLLKEEATRVREFEAREAKRRPAGGKVWVPLPDRPIQTKRQWYSW